MSPPHRQVGIAHELTPHEHGVGLAGCHNVLSLVRFDNLANGRRHHVTSTLDCVGMRHLVARRGGDCHAGDETAAGRVDDVATSVGNP